MTINRYEVKVALAVIFFYCVYMSCQRTYFSSNIEKAVKDSIYLYNLKNHLNCNVKVYAYLNNNYFINNDEIKNIISKLKILQKRRVAIIDSILSIDDFKIGYDSMQHIKQEIDDLDTFKINTIVDANIGLIDVCVNNRFFLNLWLNQKLKGNLMPLLDSNYINISYLSKKITMIINRYHIPSVEINEAMKDSSYVLTTYDCSKVNYKNKLIQNVFYIQNKNGIKHVYFIDTI